MPPKRKIVFIIVEGISDQTALAAIVSKIFSAESVIVEFTQGDITSEFGVSPSNIALKIGNFIKSYSNLYSYKSSDFLEVIHMIDTDGAFIEDHCVCESSNFEELFYETESIKTANCKNIRDRNKRKAENVKRLLSLPKVWNIPYGIYFFSCNLDHILHNNANVSWKDKDKLASQFARRYRNQPEDFLTFIQDESFALKRTYADSWAFIEEGQNSLKRFTNMNLVFSQQAKNIKRNFIEIKDI